MMTSGPDGVITSTGLSDRTSGRTGLVERTGLIGRNRLVDLYITSISAWTGVCIRTGLSSRTNGLSGRTSGLAREEFRGSPEAHSMSFSRICITVG